MRYGDNNDAPLAEQNFSNKRSYRLHNRYDRKRQKIESSETNFTRKHMDSYNYNNQKRRRMNFWKPCNQRKWTYSNQDVSNYNDRVVIVSYNILGVKNSANHPDLYKSVLPKYLSWEYRKKLLCEEVKRYQPSILCFQEVDRFNDLNNLLEECTRLVQVKHVMAAPCFGNLSYANFS